MSVFSRGGARQTILKDADLLGGVCTGCGKYMRFATSDDARRGFLLHTQNLCLMRKELLGAEQDFEVGLDEMK